MDLIYEEKGKIYQGGYRDIPSTHSQVNLFNIDTVFYCATECPPLNHHIKDMEKIYKPYHDLMYPPGTTLFNDTLFLANSIADMIVERFNNGKNILVTCSQGINRSGLAVGLALKKLTSLPGEDIVKLIQQNRPGSLSNGTFITMIEKS